MAIIIREADLQSDRSLIVRFLHDNLTENSNDDRYNWLYLQNPAGAAKIWIAWDTVLDKPAGISAAIPRTLSIKGQKRPCWILADFCMDRSYRSLGPALKLQRESLEAADKSRICCCIDFPSQTMAAIYARLGIPVFGDLGRFAKPLNVSNRINRLIPVSALSAPIGWIGNVVLRLSDLRLRSSSKIVLEKSEGVIGGEFSDLASMALKPFDVFTDRPPEYLNWRYREVPLQQNTVLAFRRAGRLVAYAIVSFTSDEAAIHEVFSLPETDLCSDIVIKLWEYLRNAGMQSASFWQSTNKNASLLGFKSGCYLRNTSPIVVYQSKLAADSGESKLIDLSFLLVNGDRDS